MIYLHPFTPPPMLVNDMEVAADADIADVLEVSSSYGSAGTPGGAPVTGGSQPQWAAGPPSSSTAAGGGDVAPRAAMALGLHRIAARVRDQGGSSCMGSPGGDDFSRHSGLLLTLNDVDDVLPLA